MSNEMDLADRRWYGRFNQVTQWVKQHGSPPDDTSVGAGAGLAAWLEQQRHAVISRILPRWKVELLARASLIEPPSRPRFTNSDMESVHGPKTGHGTNWLNAMSRHKGTFAAQGKDLVANAENVDVKAALDWVTAQVRQSHAGRLPEWKDRAMRQCMPGALERTRYVVSRFDTQIERLRAFVEAKGGAPQRNSTNPEEIALSSWVRRAEQAAADGTLTDTEETKFRSVMANAPSPWQRKFNSRVDTIEAFITDHGRIPGEGVTVKLMASGEQAHRRWLLSVRAEISAETIEGYKRDRLQKAPSDLRGFLGVEP